jgi:hypothetical protein
MLKKILKLTGFVLCSLLLVFGLLFYTQAYDYPRYPLKVDRTLFPEVESEEDIELLAQSLLAQMTLDEKIEQLYGEPGTSLFKLVANWFWLKRFPHMYVGRNERLGIPPFVLTDGPRGVRVSDDHGGATVFPVAMARGASWDVELEARATGAGSC